MKTMVLPALTALKTSGVQSWLGQELEMRGIDAMIYTRYILSILLQEDVDEMAEVDIDGGTGFGRKMGYVKVKGKKKGRVDKEELKKTAAVQCLQSVSDQDAGIESLVEELCCRLKELQAQKEAQPDGEKENVSPAVEEGEENSTSPEDQAQRYYEAFPALGDTAEPVTVAAAPTWCAKPEGSGVSSGKNSSKGRSKSSSASSSPQQSATPDNTTPTNKVSHGNKYGAASGSRVSRKGCGTGKKDNASGSKGGGQGVKGRDRKTGKLPGHTARRSKKSKSPPSSNHRGTPPFVLPKIGAKRRAFSSSASDHMKSLPLWYTEPVGEERVAMPARRSEGDYPFIEKASASAEMSYWYDGPMFEEFFEGLEAGSRLEMEYTFGDSAVLASGDKIKSPTADGQVDWSQESATGREEKLLYDQLCCIDCMHNRQAFEGEKGCEVEGDQTFRRRSGTIVEKCDREHSQSAKEQRTDHGNSIEHCQNAATSHPDFSVSLEECHRSMQHTNSHAEKQSKNSPNRTEDDNLSESSGSLEDITEAEFEDRYGSKIAPIWGRETPGSESGSIIDTSHLGDRSLFSPVSDRGDCSDAKLHIWRNRPRLGFLSERASPVAKDSNSYKDGNATFPRDVFTYEDAKEPERPLLDDRNPADSELFVVASCAECQQKQGGLEDDSPEFGAVGNERQFCFDEETTEKMNSTFPVGRWLHRKRVRRRSSDSYLYTGRESPQVRKLSTNIPMIGDNPQQTEPNFSPWQESSRIEKCEDDFSGYFSDSGYPCPNDLSFLQVGSNFITGGLYGQISMAGQTEVWETPDTGSFTPTSAPSPIFSDASSHSRSRFSFAQGSDVSKDDSADLHSVHSDSEQFADSVVLSSICTEFYKQNVGEEDPYKYAEYGPQNITESCPAFPVETVPDEAAAAAPQSGAPVSKLEYHKGESCFTEVKPKAKVEVDAVPKQSKLTHPKPNSYGSFEDEEDLFVSSRTHFKPITSRETSPDECYHSDGTEILEEEEDLEEAVAVDNIFSTPPETVEEIAMVQSVEEPLLATVEEPLVGDISEDLLPQLRKLSFEKSSQTSVNDVGGVEEPDDFSPILDVLVLSQGERTSPDGRESFDEDKDVGTEKDQLPPPPPNLWENVPLSTEDTPQSSQGMLSVEISGTWMAAAKPWSTEVDEPQELGSLDPFGEAIGGLLLDVASPHSTFSFPDIDASDPEDALPLPLPVGEERSTRLYERGCCQQGTI
ncbi:uncharacterized protein [Branchiostoma lanceolatum]|uniref:uncharacterized protein isoform X1 n=1 Tax=Branchiostoma lanceolatum TaxID=7740 RepID=UPI003452685C